MAIPQKRTSMIRVVSCHKLRSKLIPYTPTSCGCPEFRVGGDYELGDLSIDNILDFMNQLTEGRKPQTKRGRFTSLQAFFNFAKNNLDPDFTNPCDSPMLRKLFRPKVKTQFDILEKETLDEILFRTIHPRNRLMLELMARGAMRIGEVLKIVSNVFLKDKYC